MMKTKNSIDEEEIFKQEYCKSEANRKKMLTDFEVKVETFEELLPGKKIVSFATGNRDIENSFIMFEVKDSRNNRVWHPVFSETVGRQIIKKTSLELPSKITIFSGETEKGKSKGKSSVSKTKREADNQEMLSLIELARSLMVLHFEKIEPMKGVFKSIYEKLERNPSDNVLESNIKSLNTAIKNYLDKPVNLNNEKFTNLNEYISFLKDNYSNKKLKKFNFEILKTKMKEKYPDEEIVF